jgi:CRISPR-associated protein Cas5t
MKLLHAQIAGWTATFRLPMFYTGTGLTSPLPPYSTLLGLLGSLAGRVVRPEETRIGFSFQSSGTDYDLESTQRLKMEQGRLREQPNRNVAKRQFLVQPQLDLYLDNLDLRPIFENPMNVPCLGRSQDVAWIKTVDVLEVERVEQGTVHGTLLPFPQEGASGLILVLPEYFGNDDEGYTRTIGKMGRFQAVVGAATIQRTDLFQAPDTEFSVYLHHLN